MRFSTLFILFLAPSSQNINDFIVNSFNLCLEAGKCILDSAVSNLKLNSHWVVTVIVEYVERVKVCESSVI